MCNTIERGGIYWVDIPFHTGAEIAKRRPAVVLSTNGYNEIGKTVTVAFCSSAAQWQSLDTHVGVYIANENESKVLCEHIYTVDVGRVGGMIRWASETEMTQIEHAVTDYLGLTEICEEENAECAEPEEWPEEAKAELEILTAEQRGEIRAMAQMIQMLLDKLMYE